MEVAIIVVLALVAWKVWHDPPGSPTKVLEVGDRLAMPGVSWSQSPRHVVVLLSTTCPACNKSIPFYRRLSQIISQNPDIRFGVLAYQDSVDELRAWLLENKIQVQDVAYVQDPIALGFSLAPTVVILNQEGVLTDVLVGKLRVEQEKQLETRLEFPRQTAPIDTTVLPLEIGRREFDDLLQNGGAILLNIGTREVVRAGSRSSSEVHIPRDELLMRAPVELQQSRLIVIDCSVESRRDCRSAARLLAELGYKDVRLLVP